MNIQYEAQDFESQVLDHSHEIPVMVDFWAPWCEPCAILDPIIRKVAVNNKNRIRLIKVNTDNNREIAERYHINSVPAIRIFNNGEVIAAYNGLMYPPEFEAWLNEHLPDESRTRLISIKQKIERGKTENIRQQLEALIEDVPDMLEARVLLASYYILEAPRKALSLVKDVQPDSPLFAQADSIRVLAAFETMAEKPDNLEHGDGRSELLEAALFFHRKKLESAIESLLSVVSRNKYYHDAFAGRAIVALFTVLGNNHPLTREYRERYDLSNAD